MITKKKKMRTIIGMRYRAHFKEGTLGVILNLIIKSKQIRIKNKSSKNKVIVSVDTIPNCFQLDCSKHPQDNSRIIIILQECV